MANHKLKTPATSIKGNALLLLMLGLFTASSILQRHNGFINI